MTFSDKIKIARGERNLTQQQLADMVGVSKRTVAAYESTNAMPRRGVLHKLAQALQVSVEYLEKEEITDPRHGIEKDAFVGQAAQLYGAKGAREVDALLEQNVALFAGGELSQEAKDDFFEAIMRAYVTCKEEARATFGRKKAE